MKIVWHTDDPVETEETEDLGWELGTSDPTVDEPDFLVKSPEPGVWAGWVYVEGGDRFCTTHDHATSADAKAELNGGYR